jgi:hypothetical protein
VPECRTPLRKRGRHGNRQRVCRSLPSGAREGLEDGLDDRIEITDHDDLEPWKSACGSTPGDGTMRAGRTRALRKRSIPQVLATKGQPCWGSSRSIPLANFRGRTND